MSCLQEHPLASAPRARPGQAVAPYSGCALGSVSLPAADTPLFSGAFGGTSTYAPSVSTQELF
jgi:hypothetical protein